jgi:hypothetical protein
MRAFSWASALTLCALVAPSAPRANGAFHLWDVKEIFSNADGSVQFIEFFCGAASFEHFLANHPMSATSDGAVVNYTFSGNLNTQQSTANRHFLAATAGFAALPGGVAPDYTIPANFFNPNATSVTINFSGGTDVVTFSGALLPKDGVMSLTDQSPAGATNLMAGVNSPTNFAGAAGSINLGGTPPSAGDFDEDGTVDGDDLAAWRSGYGLTWTAPTISSGSATRATSRSRRPWAPCRSRRGWRSWGSQCWRGGVCAALVARATRSATAFRLCARARPCRGARAAGRRR